MENNRKNMPVLDPRFQYGQIISHKFLRELQKERGKFRFQLQIIYANGVTCTYQEGGFVKKEDAIKAREKVVHDLVAGKFCQFKFSLKEVLEWWLYDYCLETKKIAYNTFCSYKNMIYKHILKKMNGENKLCNVTIKNIERFLKTFESKSMRKTAIKIIKNVFEIAMERNYITFNPAPIAIKNVSVLHPITQKKRNIQWTLQQVQYALFICKKNYPKLYMPFLLSLTLGTRISETIAIKYSDIDFKNYTVFIQHQRGYYFDPVTKERKKGEITPKTREGIREIPLPSWVADEIVLERFKYEKNRDQIPGFHDFDYVCCKMNGEPYHRSSFSKEFKDLLQFCGYEDIHWHDLRHIYATLLKKGTNLKAVSMFLGHSSADFTEKVYVAEPEKKAHDCSCLEEFWSVAKKEENIHVSCINISDDILTEIFPC